MIPDASVEYISISIWPESLRMLGTNISLIEKLMATPELTYIIINKLVLLEYEG
jgi:hypothetical protein